MPTFEQIQEEIGSMLAIPDEELTPEQRAAMATYLDDLAGQESSKVDGFAQFVRLETARADAMMEESKRLAARAKTVKNNIDYLRGMYASIMLEHGVKKIQGNVYAISLSKSERVEVPASVNDLPPEFIRTKIEETREADKAGIKAAIAAGREVPGCSVKTIYRVQVR